MSVFSASELDALRTTQTSYMPDLCEVGLRSTTQDALGQPNTTITYGAAIPCGLNQGSGIGRMGSEVRTGDLTIVDRDAVLRLPHDTIIAADSVVRVTHRFGELLLTPLVYEVIGQPAEGASGVVVQLRAVTT